MNKILITGGTGFIGSYLIKEFLNDNEIICLVRPNTKNLDRINDIKDKITIIPHNIRDNLNVIFDLIKDVDIILHAGANPSAFDSIKNPIETIMDNVLGTGNLLEISRKLNLKRFVYYSSGEIFGPTLIGNDNYENDAYNCNSPYAASKAAGEELCISYSHSFNIPISILHINNTFGPMCQSNRFPVIVINKLLNNERINIHVGPTNKIGGRRWFYAGDVASHTRFILNHQKKFCEKWNSAGKEFIDNLTFSKMIAEILGKKLEFELIPVDRPGHDLCFSIDPSKLYNLGWKESMSIYKRLEETVNWYLKNKAWLNRS